MDYAIWSIPGRASCFGINAGQNIVKQFPFGGLNQGFACRWEAVSSKDTNTGHFKTFGKHALMDKVKIHIDKTQVRVTNICNKKSGLFIFT